MVDYSIEKSLGGVVAGIDEAGRGPWAGPVAAAAVVIDPNNIPDGIDDSKKLSHQKRENLFEAIIKHSDVGIGLASVSEIDQYNILGATKLAMQRAFAQLNNKVTTAIIDGNQLPNLPCQMQPVIKGDSKSISIAAASIIAKVTRDRIMHELALEYPAYGWQKNAGYGTKMHIEAIEEHGITEHHRKSFKPIALRIQKAV